MAWGPDSSYFKQKIPNKYGIYVYDYEITQQMARINKLL